MDCTTAVLWPVDYARDTLESVAGYDLSGVRTAVCGSRSLAADAIAARVIADREPLFAAPEPPDTVVAARHKVVSAQNGGGWLMLPLVVGGESIGMIELLAGQRERHYTTAEGVWRRGSARRSLRRSPDSGPSPSIVLPPPRPAATAVSQTGPVGHVRPASRTGPARRVAPASRARLR